MLNIFKNSSIYSFNNSFSQCTNLKTLNSTDMDLSRVESAAHMFSNCTNLVNIEGIENWNLYNLSNMSSMFSNCINFKGPMPNL